MLHLPLACHPLGMSLGCRLERLVVGQRGEGLLLPLPVEPREDIADERSILGGGGLGQEQAEQQKKERASVHQSVFSAAAPLMDYRA